jgi:deoxycytidylate deaminase
MAGGRPKQIRYPIENFEFCDSELVIAIVCAVGTDYKPIRDWLTKILDKYGYTVNSIRVSDLIGKVTADELPTEPEIARIDASMTAGNNACTESNREDIWALAAIASINAYRHKLTGGVAKELPRTAHLIFSLKRPAEVSMLRKVYGKGFFLIGVFATEKERLDYLIEQNAPKNEAQRIIKRDAEESEEKFGQRTTETFQLSDVFVQFKNQAYEQELQRFFELIFSNPYITPTLHEHAMFLAYAGSWRSGQLGRQVGAAITSRDGDVLAIGGNDVPKAGGGLYWPGPDDKRDHVLKRDSNDEERDRIVDRLLAKVADVAWQRSVQLRNALVDALEHSDLTPKTREQLIETMVKQVYEFQQKQLFEVRPSFGKILDITEYGRAVHGEMDAILSCARSGVSTRGALLYATTFPCHNCARHIIAAGIQRVYYIEPYAKSKAELLHSDAIVVEEKALKRPRRHERKIPFTHFVGVGPRRYLDLFSLSLGAGHELIRKEGGRVFDIEAAGAWPRVPLPPKSYLVREEDAIEQFDLLPSPQLRLDI